MRNCAGIIIIKLTKWLAKKFIVNVDLSLAEEDCFNLKKVLPKRKFNCLLTYFDKKCGIFSISYQDCLEKKNITANPKKN